jgi:hypothetical protein
MSQPPISKTAFLDFLFCSKNHWLKLHKPELLDKFVLSDYEQHLADEGNEVETHARNLFPGGVEVKAYGDVACRQTAELIPAKVPAIFQATFIIDGFLARNDVLAFDAKTKSWHLYEVKGTSAVHETGGGHNHLDDLAFQLSVLKRSGASVSKCFVTHLNSEYVRVADLDIEKSFKTEHVRKWQRRSGARVEYKELGIRGGAQASEAWWAMVFSTSSEEQEMIANDLKKYCGLDTYAMYAIWRHLYQLAHWEDGETFVPLLKVA